MDEQEERRATPDARKIEYTLAKIDVKLDTLETSLNTRLADQDKVVQAQFSHIDTIITHLIKAQDQQYDKILAEFKRMFDIHSEQNIADITRHSKQINFLNEKLDDHIKNNTLTINKIDERVHTLEHAPAKKTHDKIRKIKDDIRVAIISFVIGGGLVAAILTIIQMLSKGGS